MAKRATKKQEAALPLVKAGDHVLCGGNYAAMPAHWWMGLVLWADGADVLIERATMHGDRWREVVSIRDVRAVGTVAELIDLQQKASEQVRDLVREVDAATSRLGEARDAVKAKCEELRAGGLKIVNTDPSRYETGERDDADFQFRDGRDSSTAIFETLVELRDGILWREGDRRLRQRVEQMIEYAAARVDVGA